MRTVFQIFLIFSSFGGSIVLNEFMWILKILDIYIHISEQKLIPWWSLDWGGYCHFTTSMAHYPYVNLKKKKSRFDIPII